MSTGASGPEADERTAEERAEVLMERLAGGASRFVGRFVGRAREEFEDMLAEARSINRGDRDS